MQKLIILVLSFLIPPGYAAVHTEQLQLADTVLDVRVHSGSLPYNSEKILSWLKQASSNVRLAYGRFPREYIEINVYPVARPYRHFRSPVPFGRVTRYNGEKVDFYIDQRQALEAFNQDWTATHEFSHLLLPHIKRKHLWISEGIATYYQNVLLARAGVYSEQKAWNKLLKGFARGRRAAPEQSPNQATAKRNGRNFMKVYWSGAALALIADVQLRNHPTRPQSLDDVLKAFLDCCMRKKKVWTGVEFFSRLDQLSQTDIFSQLYARYADAPDFPDISPVLDRLGVSKGWKGVTLNDNSAGAIIRQAIMRSH